MVPPVLVAPPVGLAPAAAAPLPALAAVAEPMAPPLPLPPTLLLLPLAPATLAPLAAVAEPMAPPSPLPPSWLLPPVSPPVLPPQAAQTATTSTIGRRVTIMTPEAAAVYPNPTQGGGFADIGRRSPGTFDKKPRRAPGVVTAHARPNTRAAWSSSPSRQFTCRRIQRPDWSLPTCSAPLPVRGTRRAALPGWRCPRLVS